MEFRAIQVLTPEDAHSTHFFWTYSHNFNLDDPNLTRVLADRFQTGFDEDRAVIEAQQAVILERPDAVTVDLAIDQGPMLGRSLLNRYLTAERDGSRGSGPSAAA